jgi:hypothetical protein
MGRQWPCRHDKSMCHGQEKTEEHGHRKKGGEGQDPFGGLLTGHFALGRFRQISGRWQRNSSVVVLCK